MEAVLTFIHRKQQKNPLFKPGVNEFSGVSKEDTHTSSVEKYRFFKDKSENATIPFILRNYAADASEPK